MPLVDHTIAGPFGNLVEQLHQQHQFAAVCEALKQQRSAAVEGCWGSACSLVSAALAREATGPVVVVSPHLDDLADLADEVALFLGESVSLLPAWEVPPEQTDSTDEVFAERLRTLKQLWEGQPLVVAASIHSLMQPVPEKDLIHRHTRSLAQSQEVNLDELLTWMSEHGMRNMPAVELPGEFSHRGGILDLFGPDWEEPVRVEFFGDEIDSIRRFDIASQRSLGTLEHVELTLLPLEITDQRPVTEHFPENTWFVLLEPPELEQQARSWLGKLKRRRGLFTVDSTLKRVLSFPTVTLAQLPGSAWETVCPLNVESVERYQGTAGQLAERIEKSPSEEQTFIVCASEAEVEKLQAELPSLDAERRVYFPQGRLRAGFRLVNPQAVVLSGSELLGRREAPRAHGKRHLGRSIDSFLELKEGDYVVHLAHGIGKYRGMRIVEKDKHREEHLELEFHGGTLIFVPTSKIDLVQKYIGGSHSKPPLSRIGGKAWAKRKEQAATAANDLASEMLDLQAQRESQHGIAFEADTEWQQKFETHFPYTETPDQLTAISAIKADMQRERPMDRLICGEVGFGKTELAMRAAFKAVDSGYQVAMLVPTTILAEQHYRSFCERMVGFPFEIGCLSRFRTKAQQKELLERAALGQVDIVIGTHRLLQADVHFDKLGLLIVDEEQRFGVEAKEYLKLLRRTVDVLTLTATPIPRTLHMSLLGIRDISNLETPPANRLAVETRVTRFDEELIEYAIRRELGRGGQVFFVHNRVNSLERVRKKLAAIVPEARIAVGHGQMPEDELSRIMLGFVEHQYDILLSTTIVESGLDIPRANTIFIDDADRYGLAELHQLRGRVGRYKHRAYCYLLVDPKRPLTNDAARRLKAIEEFSSIGAGFGIAMRDLEIRGAGNIIGTEQSGHIAAVGYELYCQLLESAVRRMREMPEKTKVQVNLDLPGEAFLPRHYIPDMRMKIDLYRRLSRVSNETELAEIVEEMEDRFGRVPEVVTRLIRRSRLRIWAFQRQISSVHLDGAYVVFRYQDRNSIAELVLSSRGAVRVVDDRYAYYPFFSSGDADELLAEVESLLQPNAGSG